jgi:uncharacterized membrane protein YoaK (UPF0700 family)
LTTSLSRGVARISAKPQRLKALLTGPTRSNMYPIKHLTMLGWHKKLTKRLRKRLGLTKYQFMWLSFVKGLVIGCLLTLAFSS